LERDSLAAAFLSWLRVLTFSGVQQEWRIENQELKNVGEGGATLRHFS